MSEQRSTSFSCKLSAFGAWGKGFANWDELVELIQSPDALPKEESLHSKGPKPEVIPANERRRSPLPVKLAVESSWQATQMAGVDPSTLTCVFVSGFGDTQLTDYMCKVLATESKELSPTKFHNSVHNAAAGYWTISTGCEKAANSVAGFQDSVSLTLMEAMIQCQQEQKAILLTFFDAPVSSVLTDIMGPGSAFSFSIIIEPCQVDSKNASDDDKDAVILSARVSENGCDWPVLTNAHGIVEEVYHNNPSARILSLIEMIQGIGSKERYFPMGEFSSLHVSLV
ncbi:MAG: beta-ketoacyl synthase chain length factor [Cellvibrionaceae bacterium]